MHSINIMTWTVLAIVPYLLTASAEPLAKRQFDGELFDGISGFNDIGASEGIIGGEEGLISSGGREVIGGEDGILGGGRVITSGSRLIEGGLDDEFGDISSGFRGGLESDGFDSVGSFWWNGNRIFSNNFVNSVSNSFRIPRRTVQIIIIQMSRIRSSGNIFQSSRRIARSNNVPIINIVRMGRLSWRYLRNRGFTRSNSSRNRNLIIVIRTMSSGSFVRRMRPTRVVVVIPSVSNRFSRWSRQSRISANSWNSLIQDCFFQWSRGVWGRSGNVLLNGGSWSEGGFNGDSRFDSTWEDSWGSAESWITGSGCCDSFLGSDSLFGKKRRDVGSDKMQTAAADFIDAVSNNADTLCKADSAKTWMAKFSKTSGLDQTVMAGIAGEVVNMMMDDDITKDNMAMFDAFSCVAMSAVDMDQLPEAFGKSVSESQDAAMNLLMETPAEAVEADKADKKEQATKVPMTKEEMDAMTPAEKEAAAKKPMTKEEMDAMTPAEKEAAAKKPMTKEEMDAMPKEPSTNSNKVAMSAEEMAKMPMKAMTAEEMAKMPKKAMTPEEMAKMPKKAMSAEEMAKMPKKAMSAEEMAKMPKMSAEEMAKMPKMSAEEMAKMPKMSAEEMAKMPKMSADEMAKMPMKAMTPEEMAKMPKKAMSAEEMAKMPMKAMTPEEMAKMPMKAMTPEEMAKMPASAQAQAQSPNLAAKSGAMMVASSAFAFISILLF